MTNPDFAVEAAVQRETQLIRWVLAERRRIASLPPGERRAATAKLERIVRRELMSR